MAKSSTIRGLERGLRVLTVLDATPIAALHDLHDLTGIPKPSLLRILNTLEQAGLVSRRLGDGRYRISVNLAFTARKRDRYERLAEAAAPVLDRLCQRLAWPSDLVVPAGDHLENRETSRTRSPYVIQRDRVGHKINWLLSAVGRAYLAFCPDKERQKILAAVRKSDQPEDRLARDPKRLERILAETRERGYGTREAGFLGGYYGRAPYDDGLAAIAVPILDGRRVHGALNLLWTRQAFTVEEFAARHLADLHAAVDEIVNSLNNPRRRATPRAPGRS